MEGVQSVVAGKNRIISELKSLIAGEIFTVEDASYKEQVEKTWNKLIWQRKPLALVVVANREDIMQTVKFCRKNKVDLCVYGGGNTNFALADNSLVIVMTKMNSVTVDVEQKVALVGAGAKLSEVDEVTVKHGLVAPLGSYSALGVAGHTLMGGAGFLTRRYGLTADNVIKFDLVNADGDVISASADENSDLFWGLRGMGSNFGIVTTIKMQLYEVPKEVLGGVLRYPWSQAAYVLKTTRDLMHLKNEKRLCIYMMIHIYDDGPQVVFRFFFGGPPEEGQNILRELCEKTTPIENTVTRKPHNVFQQEGDQLVRPGRFYAATLGNFVPELTDEILDNLVDSLNNVPDSKITQGTHVYVTPLGGRSGEMPCESSPYPFRKAEYWVGVLGAANDERNYQAVLDWVRETDHKNSATGITIGGSPESKKQQEKLKYLKKKYDPNNFFHHNPNINPNS